MSFRRAQSRTINRNTLLDNRLSTFLSPPVHTGDLYVEGNETIGGNLTIGKDLKATNFYASGNYYLDDYVLIPAGTVIQSAAISEPAGWFDCNGRLLNVSDYPALYNAIGHTYGGSGSTFRLPDMRGKVTVGQDGGASWAMGATGGEASHTLTENEIPSHTHSLLRKLNQDDGAFDPNSLHATESSAATTDRPSGNVNTPASPPIYFNTYGTGGGQPHNNMQPYIVLRHLIKY